MNARRVFWNRIPWLCLLLLFLTCLSLKAAVDAQTPAEAPDADADATAAETSESSAPEGPSYDDSVENHPFGVPYSSAAKDVNLGALRTLDPFNSQLAGVNVNEYATAGNLSAHVNIGSAGAGLPGGLFLYRGFPPQNAQLKIGPLYFKLDNLTAEYIYTDNYRLSTHHRKSEQVAVFTAEMMMIVQVTSDLQFGISATGFYLPIQNVAGFNTSGLGGSLAFLLSALPLMSANVSYDVLIAGWPVYFEDYFNTLTGAYSDSTRDSFNLFTGSAINQDRNGKYVFHSGLPNDRTLHNFNSSTNSINNYFSAYANTVSAYTTNQIPGDIQLTARASRTDLWYNENNRGLPSSRDDFYALAEMARPNLRFTMFASYDISHSSDVPGVFQTVTAGLYGPINDQLYLRASAGYFLSNTGRDGELWLVDLAHDAGRYTTEDFVVAQVLSDFNDEVITTEYYRLNQVLGPTLNGILFADHSSFREFSKTNLANRDQEDVGAGLYWTLGPMTSLEMNGIYTHQHFDNGYIGDSFTGRISLWRTISDTLFFRAFYQYQRFTANQADNGYFENLVFLSLVKYFR